MFGRTVEIDLSSGKVASWNVNENILQKFIGGRGLGIYFLQQMTDSQIEPLSPDNLLIFTVGPACGTSAPSSGLYCVTTKSPLTGTCLSAHSGGHFGAALRYSGIDALIIRGAANRPCYILIDQGQVEIKDAASLWGLDTEEADQTLKRIHSGFKAALIGPAGENQVLMAAIINDGGRAAARGGPGAVMGSKKLKAVVVRDFADSIEVAHVKDLQQLAGEANILTAENGLGLSNNGTSGVVEVANSAGIFPTRNFQTAFFPDAHLIGADALRPLRIRNRACFGCIIACGKVNKAGNIIIEGPEYETIYALGSNCGNGNVESIVRLNALCNRWGLDTISTGGAIAFAMELYQRGIISGSDTGGLKLEWGNSDIMEELVRCITYRRNIGNLLAQGVSKAAEKIGPMAAKYAVHVKNLDPAGYDPRGILGMGLAYATSNRGACHLRAMMHVIEVFQGKMDRFSWQGKAKVLIELQDISSVIDSLVMCKFTARYGFNNSPEKIGCLLRALIGTEITPEEVVKNGERIYNLERFYNVNNGFSRKDDILPERFFEEAVPNGPTQGRVVDREGFQKALDEYYFIRGWDTEGRPTQEKMQSLGLI